MSYRGLLFVVVTTAAGCASASYGGDSPDAGPGADGRPPADAPSGIDAPVTSPDAPTGCQTMTRNLLTNPAFDMTPIGTGWTQTPINATYPIITADGTIVQSTPNKAWMGGLAQANAIDSLYQDVMVPAGTTSLVLTGFYEIRSGELLNLPYDYVDVDLTTTTGTVLQSVLALDNSDKTTAWTPINVTFTQAYAGQTVRLRFQSESDDSYATSFYFDSLALTATYCQ